VRYIGVSSSVDTRLKDHLGGATACAGWIRQLDRKPVMTIVLSGLTRSEAIAAEMRLIFLHQTMYPGRLVNSERYVLAAKRVECIAITRYINHRSYKRRREAAAVLAKSQVSP